MKEYVGTLQSYAMDKDRSWTVTAVGPKARDSDVHIKDKDELCRLYAMKKPSQLDDPSLTVQVAEMQDAARHITHIHSHFIWRFCLDDTEENVNKMCELCKNTRRQARRGPELVRHGNPQPIES